MKTAKSIKEKVLKEYKKGNIVVSTQEGLMTIPLKECLEQPTEGLLYDLNRDTGTILTLIDDPKWINDYALSRVVIELKKQLEKFKSPSLPEITDEMIENAVEKYSFRVPYDGTDNFYDEVAAKHYGAGIKWALSLKAQKGE